MGAHRREKLSVRLDWVTVPYKNVYAGGAGVALLIIVAIALFTFREPLTDMLSRARKDARAEIAQADRLVEKATRVATEAKTHELRESASAKLLQARYQYGKRDYQDAKTSAILSQNDAQKVIDIAQGDAGAGSEVRFYKIEGEVRLKRAGQFRWEDASTGIWLKIGDQVKTGPRSVAQIIYFDGTVTTIRPESLLEIKDLYEEPNTRERRVREKLNWGELETTTRKANVAGSFHEIQSETASAKSHDDAEFKVAYDRTKNESSIAVYNGKVDASTDQAEVTMKPGDAVSIDNGVLGTVQKLPQAPRLIAPVDQRIFVSANTKDDTTTLAWEKLPAALHYHLQLSARSLFSDMLLDKNDVKNSTVVIPGLPPSAYYWRVAMVDAKGRGSAFSPPRKFRVTTTEIRDRADKTPPLLALQDFILNGHYVIMNGKTEPGAVLWIDGERVEVDETGVFYSVAKLKREGKNEVLIVAQDAAGNESRQTREAYVESY